MGDRVKKSAGLSLLTKHKEGFKDKYVGILPTCLQAKCMGAPKPSKFFLQQQEHCALPPPCLPHCSERAVKVLAVVSCLLYSMGLHENVRCL